MATSLQVFQFAVLTDANGERHLLGSMSDPVNLAASFSGNVERKVYSLASSGTATIWIAVSTAAAVSSLFRFLWIRADKEDVMVQLTTDLEDDVGTERYTIKLKKDLAFILGSDDSYANYSLNFSGGTLDIIDEIRVKNLGSETASVEVVIAK